MKYKTKYQFFSIGEKIRELRKRNPDTKSQEAFIDVLKERYDFPISRNTLSRIENGDITAFSLDFLLCVSDLFNCDIGYLLGEYNEATAVANKICEITGLSEKAVIRISNMKNFCIDYDGIQVSGNDAFEALNDYLSVFASEAVSIYIAKMKEINEDYLFLCLIQCIYKDDRHKYDESGEMPLNMACFNHKKLSNDIKEKSEKCDMSYFRASRTYESFLKQYQCNTIGEYYNIKDIYERLYDTFGYTKEQVDEKVKTIWKEYDKVGYKKWQT